MKHDGHTVLLTTHYLDEAEQLCDRIAIIDRGRVIAVGRAARADGAVGGDADGVARRRRSRSRAQRFEAVARIVDGLQGDGSPLALPERAASTARVAALMRSARSAQHRSHRAARAEGVARRRVPRAHGRAHERPLFSRLAVSLRAALPEQDGADLQLSVPDDLPARVLGALSLRNAAARPAHGRAADGHHPRRRLLRPADDDGQRAGARRVAALSADAGLDRPASSRARSSRAICCC